MGTGDSAVETTSVRGRWYHFAACVGSAVLLVVLLFVPAATSALLRAEHWASDWRTAFLSDRLDAAHPKVAIVYVTEDSIEEFPAILPINRGYLARLVTALDEAGAVAIGLDFYFARHTEPSDDAKLISALQHSKDKVVLGVYETSRNKLQLAYQLNFIAKAQARAGYINLASEADRIVRYRASPPSDARYKDSFSSALAKMGGWSEADQPERIGWLLAPANGGDTFLEIEAHKLLRASPEERSALLKGRVVLVGGKLFTLDRHGTPLSVRTQDEMTGVEIHAQMVAELIDNNRSYRELNSLQTRILLAVLICVAVPLGLRYRRREFDFLDWRWASLTAIALDLALFRFRHLILPFTLTSVAWIASVTVGTQLRNAIAWWQSR